MRVRHLPTLICAMSYTCAMSRPTSGQYSLHSAEVAKVAIPLPEQYCEHMATVETNEDFATTEMPVLTHRQLEALLAVVSHLAKQGVSPSMRELREAMGVAANTNVTSYLAPLFDKELLSKPNEAYARRAYKLTSKGAKFLSYLLYQRNDYPEITKYIDTYFVREK